MPHDFQCEAIVKFLIPDRPQEDNYPDPNEFEEKEKEWMEQWDWALHATLHGWRGSSWQKTDVSRRPPVWCRRDSGSWEDPPPGPRFKGPSMVSTILSKEG